MKRPHGEEVCHHGAESRGEAGLGDEAQLELGQTDDVVPLLPVPAGDVEQVGLQSDESQNPQILLNILEKSGQHNQPPDFTSGTVVGPGNM